jgi:hypothetical protein
MTNGGGYVHGGSKVGPHVWTYSRTPVATCPGRSAWCQARCYDLKSLRYSDARSKRAANSDTSSVPAIPANAKWLRIHIGGDFDRVAYLKAWIRAIERRPDVLVWAYTRSWRVKRLLPFLEQLRALPNVQLFASTDPTISEPTPDGWRVAHVVESFGNGDQPTGYACPEQTGRKRDCESCSYCFRGRRGDVVFAEH